MGNSSSRARIVAALLSTLVVAAAGAVVAPLSAGAATVSTADAVAQILADTNALRAAGGLAPLVESSRMDSVAQTWSAQMAASGSFVHNPGYASQIPTGWTAAGENIATGQTVTTVVEAWHQSSAHYANIMGDYTDIGIGYYVTASGTTYFTQDFGKYATHPDPAPSSASSPTATPTPSATATTTTTPSPTATPTATPTPTPTPAAAAAPVLTPVGSAGSTAATPVVSGSKLLDSRSGKTWVAHAVNWPSFEYACQQGWGESADGATTAAAAAMVSWGINAVRVPLNQDCWLGVDGAPATGTPASYQAAVAAWVKILTKAGLVVILDLHWTAPSGSVADGQRAMPDAQSVGFWSQVASVYRNSPSVLLETFNEPYSRGSYTVSWSCWKNGGCIVPASNDASAIGTTTYTAHGQAELVAAIRAAGATQPILLDGLNYANDLAGWLANRPDDSQLVASWHNYDGQGCSTVSCWNSQILPVAASVPVITTEFGVNSTDTGYITGFMNWADANGIGYAPWAWWVTDSSDSPAANLYSLISNLSSFTPRAPEGTAYHDHLAAISGPVSTAALPALTGSVDSITGGVGMIQLTGWAAQTNAPTSTVSIALNYGSTWVPFSTGTANSVAPTKVTGAGPTQGFSGTASVPPGTWNACVWAAGPSTAAINLGCKTVTVQAPPPAIGTITATPTPGGATITGWAAQPDNLGATANTALQIGSTWIGLTANQASTAASAATGSANHGYSYQLPLNGPTSVCLWANSSSGVASNLGCTTATPLPAVVGAIDTLTGGVGKITTTGWAAAPAAPTTPLAIAINYGTTWIGTTTTQTNTVAPTKVAGAGPAQGYTLTTTTPPGTYNACIWAAPPTGAAINLGCKTVTVQAAPAPVGGITAVSSGAGKATIAGWAAQPDASSSAITNAALQVGGSWYSVTANQASTAAANGSASGPNHGFTFDVPLTGAASVCLWANSTSGAAYKLGCATAVPLAPLMGAVDSITGGLGKIQFSGWAALTSAPSSAVTIALNYGSTWVPFSTGAANSVAPTRVPGAGPNQGYVGSANAPAGSYTACVWAAGPGVTAINLGCAPISVAAAPAFGGSIPTSFPNSSNTGVPAGTALSAYTGPCTISVASTVIDAKTINCATLEIRAKNVVISRSVINGTVYADPTLGLGSFTVSDTLINVGTHAGTGIGDGNFTAIRVHVTGGNRSVNCSLNCTIQDSLVHGQFTDSTGVYHESGIRIGSGSVIRGNTIACDAPDVAPDAGCSAALTGYGDFAVVQNDTIDGNLFIAGSGGYCSYGGSTTGKPYSAGVNNIRFTNNVWQRGSSGKCGSYGPITAFNTAAPGNVWSNNTWDIGAVVPPAN